MDEIELEWLLPDGRAAGRGPDGLTVRVAGAVPGDVVRARRAGGSGRTVDAVVDEVVRPAPARRAAICPVSASCGGCDLDVLEPEARRGLQARMVARAFRLETEVPIVPSPRQEGHRARIKLAIEGGRCGYRAARSHALVEPEVCRIARPEVQEAHARLRSFLRERDAAGLAAVEIRSDGARAVFAFESNGPVDRAALAALGDVALDGKRLHGDPTLVLEVDGVPLRCSPRSFFQVNLEGNALLVAHVRDALLARRPERLLDLYAGIGNLSLPLAARGVPVTAVEAPGAAAEDLRANAAPCGAQVVAATLERFDPSRTPFDAVVLDPPRAGAPGVLERVTRQRPRTIVYVSCFPPSAAKDLQEVRGYRVASVTAFELFPDTHHVEAVVVLERA